MQTNKKQGNYHQDSPIMNQVTLTAKHYIFGYGSLMNSLSRRNTLPLDTVGIPVLVNGLERTWSYKCNENKYTAVAVRSGPSLCNGVLIELPNPSTDLELLDRRESEYERRLIDHSRIIPWNASDELWNDGNAVIWVYQLPNSTKSNHLPCMDYPIPQSYLDTIISGCLSYGQEFTKLFLKLTGGWTRDYLMNDRKRPLKRFTIDKVSIDPMLFDYLIQENVAFE